MAHPTFFFDVLHTTYFDTLLSHYIAVEFFISFLHIGLVP